MKDTKISKLRNEELLTKLELWFQNSYTWDSDYKTDAKLWYDYYHGRQWTSEEISALEARGQAVTTYNHIKPAIDSIVGSERKNRPKITMAGRTLDDGSLADAKTKLYSYIEYNSRTDDEVDKMEQDALVTGRGWIYIYPQPDVSNETGNMDVLHSFVDYRDMFVDPMSKRDDMTDSRYLHYAVFTDNDVVKSQFPKFKEETSDNGMYGFESSSDDEIWYGDTDRTRVRLINTWYRDEDGKVYTVVWVKGQILYFKEQPYSTNRFPFVSFTCYRDMDNKPYGLVKSMISAQDEVNKRHSKAMHYLNSSQYLAEEDAFLDWNEAEKTLAKPNGVTKLTDGALSNGKIQRIDNTQLASVHIQMMQIAKENIFAGAGINASYVGQSSQYESAKKANVSIAQAQNSIVPILNKLRIARYELAYITMKLVADFYTEQRIIRIIEPNGKYSFMPLNQISLMDDGTITKVNDVTNDDVDIIIEEAPAGLNERQEQLNMLLQIQGQTNRPIPMEILLRYMDLKDKHQLADDLKSYYSIESQLQQSQQFIEQLQQQVKQLGGQINQQQFQIVQERTARQVEKEVNKNKEKIGLGYGL